MPPSVGPTTIAPTILSPSSIALDMLDADAVRATQRLNQRGFDAYLVGGCVRDLLLGRSPKDYDIATAARPQQVKRTFPRNCRIIGRRFKLAHLHFHDNTKILEVSTFRRTPQVENTEDDLLITHDNEFGTAEEDALRRDFTVNALFLDPSRDRILDYANGLEDLRTRTIRTIGDPRVRFREDPVRILRAAKFAGRLGFQVDPETLAAMAEAAPDLVRAAPPRLLEEILRLLRGGHSLESFQLLRDVGALKSLVPIVADFLGAAPQPQRVTFWRLLEALDHRVLEGKAPSNPVLLGSLFFCPVQVQTHGNPHRSPTTIAEELLGPLGNTLRLPRRDAGCLKRICGVQHRFVQLGENRRFKVRGFVHGPYFEEALELFELRAEAAEIDEELVAEWQALARNGGGKVAGPADPEFDAAEAGDEAADDDGEDTGAEQDRREMGRGEPDGADDRAEGEPRSRRRRRRRRRRGGEARDEREEGGTATHADRSDYGPDDEREHDEPSADDADFDGREAADDADGDLANEPRDDDEGEGEEGERAERGADTATEGGARRKRRRRRRRGGKDRGGDRPEDAAAEQAPRAPAPKERPADERPADERKGDDRKGDRGKTRGRRGRDRERDRDGDRRGGRKKRGRDRRDHPGGRDVDVVPRGRDRRGKVEVLEPKQLDLSAFDIELDPKRVPTFGSIVEGKSRPKRRGPRLPDEGRDDYKPPPPPGGDGPDDAPPPPPDDTFGDW
ncbi:MAG: polynucleotide adenylyltransferase PcnB [Planctomycetota bacterium]